MSPFKSFHDSILRRRRLTILAVLSLIMGFVTYFLLSKVSVSSHGARTLTYVLLVDLAFLILLTIVIIQRLVKIWASKRENKPGSMLQSRMVVLFGFIAGAPTLLVTFFSALFFHYGVEQWFDHKFAQGLDNATVIAQSYFEEQRDALAKSLSLATRDLSTSAHRWSASPEALERYLFTLMALHNWQGITVYEVSSKGQEIVMSVSLPNTNPMAIALLREPYGHLPSWVQDITQQGSVAIMDNTLPGKMIGLLEIRDHYALSAAGSSPKDPGGKETPSATDGQPRYFLMAVKGVSGKLMEYARETMDAAAEYKILESRKLEIKIAFSVIFAFVSLLILLGAISMGLIVANAMARPIALLVEGAEKVAKGHLHTVVEAPHADGDMRRLVDSFNTMVANLQTQQKRLLMAYHDLKERSTFIESLLAGVSSGVLELSPDGKVREHNAKALSILGVVSQGAPSKNGPRDGESGGVAAFHLKTLVPEAWPVFLAAKNNPNHYAESRITHSVKGHVLTLYVRFSAEFEGSQVMGYVMTFDDLTQYLMDQRKAAWADVARRIAHEIKNPLTPIQLSAERLKRRCAPKLEGSDADMFRRCIETIIRQVETIGSMVNEFSGFARMPSPVFSSENLSDMVKNLVALQQQAYPAIDFQMHLPAKDVMVVVDARQISQVLTNLFKNAVEAIEETVPPPAMKIIRCSVKELAGDGGKSQAMVSSENKPSVELILEDSGPGWPHDEKHRLTEPYFTTRNQGTGLGLAIALRIVEDHGGLLELGTSQDLHGALVRLVIPIKLGQTGDVS